MTENNQQDKSQKKILEQIKSGAVKMRPRAFFVFETAMLIVLISILVILTVFLISFVFFVLKNQAAAQHTLGAALFMSAFPFLPALIALFVVFVLIALVKKFHVGYAHPMLYLIIVIVGTVILASILVHKTSFHERFFCYTKLHQTPVLDRFYEQYKLHELCEHESGAPEPLEFWEGFTKPLPPSR